MSYKISPWKNIEKIHADRSKEKDTFDQKDTVSCAVLEKW